MKANEILLAVAGTAVVGCIIYKKKKGSAAIGWTVRKKRNAPKSFKACLEVADRYGYSIELVSAGRNEVYLSCNSPFYRSPYPSSFYSEKVSEDYARRIWDKRE